MTLTLLSISDDLIPLFGVVCTMAIPIVAIFLYYRQKGRIMDERKLMIEKGIAPPELKSQLRADTERQSPMSKGINMLAIAIGIVIGYFVSRSWGTSPPISIGCAILFFLGAANILKSFLFPNDQMNEHE